MGETIEGTESHVITSVVTKALGKPLVRPREDHETVAIKDPKPFLRCYKGTQEGAIYPLNVVCSSSSLRYSFPQKRSFHQRRPWRRLRPDALRDLIIETASDDKAHEFTNIDREELPALQKYVKGYLEARAAAAAAAAGGDEDSDEDDDDYDGEDSEEEDEDDDSDSDDDDDYADENEETEEED